MFSVELVRLYLAIGSEIDVVLKELCKKINPKSKAIKINEYKETITPEIEGFIKFYNRPILTLQNKKPTAL